MFSGVFSCFRVFFLGVSGFFWVFLGGYGFLSNSVFTSDQLSSNISDKRDGVDGFGHMQPYFFRVSDILLLK